jgi:hypothetical protein
LAEAGLLAFAKSARRALGMGELGVVWSLKDSDLRAITRPSLMVAFGGLAVNWITQGSPSRSRH